MNRSDPGEKKRVKGTARAKSWETKTTWHVQRAKAVEFGSNTLLQSRSDKRRSY